MTPAPQSEATLFSDSNWVIIGYHLPFNEAIQIIEKEDPELVPQFTDVDHWWVRYEFADADEREDFGITSWWRLRETTERPKGIVKPATVMK
jgi:hypothetical protein